MNFINYIILSYFHAVKITLGSFDRERDCECDSCLGMYILVMLLICQLSPDLLLIALLTFLAVLYQDGFIFM